MIKMKSKLYKVYCTLLHDLYLVYINYNIMIIMTFVIFLIMLPYEVFLCLQHEAPTGQVGISMGRHKWVGISG